ncbi:unnamed protein product [Cylicostephanus goldi]|uniref:Uncharacterized protein n=1 Tax=Cylicostephanus goldi TaxID=71465 RepID=A0A3P6T0H5_CYLGO|nr:unnamed protein product [Cylicostephanus goldi]
MHRHDNEHQEERPEGVEEHELHEGGDNDRPDEAARDVDVGAGMFVFADEGAPSDDEELGEDDRMGLHWLNAILGFERDRVQARLRQRRAREPERTEHVESETSSNDSSSDTSSNADEAEEHEAEHPLESGNNEGENAEAAVSEQSTELDSNVNDRDSNTQRTEEAKGEAAAQGDVQLRETLDNEAPDHDDSTQGKPLGETDTSSTA